MQYPDEINSLTQLTMERFVGHSQYLYTAGQDPLSELAFVRFVLAGRVGPNADEEPDQGCVTLNCLQGLPPLPPTRITRDLDSAIGVSHTLPYTSALGVWPVPPFKETLKKDNHARGIAYESEVRQFKCRLLVVHADQETRTPTQVPLSPCIKSPTCHWVKSSNGMLSEYFFLASTAQPGLRTTSSYLKRIWPSSMIVASVPH